MTTPTRKVGTMTIMMVSVVRSGVISVRKIRPTTAAPDPASLGGYGRVLPAIALVCKGVSPAPLGR
jgi:hypothetical protein